MMPWRVRASTVVSLILLFVRAGRGVEGPERCATIAGGCGAVNGDSELDALVQIKRIKSTSRGGLVASTSRGQHPLGLLGEAGGVDPAVEGAVRDRGRDLSNELPPRGAAAPLSTRSPPKRPTAVKVAALYRHLRSIDIKRGTFSADLVISLRWVDPRATTLVQPNKSTTTLDWGDASAHIWLPDIAIVNREHDGVQILSGEVSVSRGGSVSTTQYVRALMRATFDISAFPFDQHTFSMEVEPRVSMTDQVLLEVAEEPSLLGADVLFFDRSVFHTISTHASSAEDEAASIHKSRLHFDIQFGRDCWPFIHDNVYPEFALMIISASVFYLPLTTAFVMPRIATGTIAFMSLVAMMEKTSNSIPEVEVTFVWFELFEDSVMVMSFAVVVLNVFVEWVRAQPRGESLSMRMGFELKIIVGVMQLLIVGICYAKMSGTHITFWASMIYGIVLVGSLSYMCIGLARFWWNDWRDLEPELIKAAS